MTKIPAFEYDVHLDCNEKITNIFWVDAKMIIDYAHLGDVVTFNTRFRKNNEYLPLSVSWLLHFYIYDETFESLKWLFNTSSYTCITKITLKLSLPVKILQWVRQFMWYL